MRKYLVLWILIAALVISGCNIKVTPTVVVPQAPTNLQAAATSTTSIVLTWRDVSNTETGFRIYRGTSATSVTNLIDQVGAGVTTYSNTGLTPGTTYYYQVKAFNTAGDSAGSNVANAKTEAEVIPTVPTAPASLAATASGNSITIEWSDNSTDETGYTIYRGTTGTEITTQIARVGVQVTAYTDTGLAYETTYYYQVTAYNAVGESNRSNIANATTETEVIPTVPAAPANLTAEVVERSIILNWNDNSVDELGFRIYRGTSSTAVNELVTGVAAGMQTFTDSGLAYGTTYYYRVNAYNAIGESSGSNITQATTIPEPTPPAAPTGLSAVGDGTTVSLNWLDQSDDETGFRIYRRTNDTAVSALIAEVAAGVSSYTDEASYATTYFYQVKAYNAAGESAGSNIAEVTTGAEPAPPIAPSSLTAAGTGTSVTLNWSDNSADEQGFRIYRGTSETALTLLTICNSGVTSFIDTGLPNEMTYYYLVTAYNAVGESLASNLALASTIPAVPTNLFAEAVSVSGIMLSWQDKSATEQGFKLYRGSSATAVTTLLAELEPGVMTYSDQNLDWGTAYYYQVKAYNQAGVSPASNTASATTLIPPTTVNGQIVNQYGQGVQGMTVQLEAGQAITGADGEFAFTVLQAGSYTIRGEGGTDAHYLLDEQILSLNVGDNQVGSLIAYQEMGVGVIIQSIDSQALSLSVADDNGSSIRALKELDFSGTWVNPFREVERGRRPYYRPAAFSGLQNNLAFIYLQWEPLLADGIVSYRVIYQGTGGTTSQEVWSSADLHPEDPDYQPLYPAAYLDLGNELASQITAPGLYYFTIEAIVDSNGMTQQVSLPQIQVSLGMSLDNYPANLALSGTTLTWTGVPAAAGYRVRIYDETDMRVYDSGPELLTAVYTEVPLNLIAGAYYTWMVDAQALDASGWPKELTRGISAFVR